MDYCFIFYSFNFLKVFLETIHASYTKERKLEFLETKFEIGQMGVVQDREESSFDVDSSHRKMIIMCGQDKMISLTVVTISPRVWNLHIVHLKYAQFLFKNIQIHF